MPDLRRAVVLCVAFALGAGAAAAMAVLVRQYSRVEPAGESIIVCVYGLGGTEFEKIYPAGTLCPRYAEM